MREVTVVEEGQLGGHSWAKDLDFTVWRPAGALGVLVACREHQKDIT